ncbi:MAG: N-acetyltransferase family protein [Hyphomicrobium sp.]
MCRPELASLIGKIIVNMQIRAARIDDIAAIVACQDLAFASSNENSAKHDATLDKDRVMSSQVLEGVVHLLCDGDKVLGYISIWPTTDHLFVDTVAVLPNHHRQGLGTLLLSFAEREARRRRLHTIKLFTMATMANNLRFYERRGYREIDRCDEDGLSRVFYCKDVSTRAA